MNGPVSSRRYIECKGPSRVGAGRLRNSMAVSPGVQSNPFPGLPRYLSCSVSPLHGLAQLEEATEALAHGIGRDQLSETPIIAASGCHWRRDAAVGMEEASEGLRIQGHGEKPDNAFQAQKGCWELRREAPGVQAALLFCPWREWGWQHPSPSPISWGQRCCHIPC